MKWIIASDIHGSAYWGRRLLEAADGENADRLLLLGDILYHGPRNDLPRGYDPKTLAKLLNEYSGYITSVRGNCDAEIDQMVLDFPVMADYALLLDGERTIFATHGHIFNTENPPKLRRGDILLHGHTHVPVCREYESFIYINPGSVSIPKEDSPNSYIVYEDGVFIWKEFSGKAYMKYLPE
ncbi:MAG: phosphodiesterase [Candidatus Limivicinus sp.]